MSETRLALAGRLVAGVAHDLNNILGAMLAAAEAIADRPGVDGETRADAADLAATARRGAALVRHLVAFVRDTPPAPRRLELRQALEDLRGLLRHLVGRGVAVTLRIEGEPAARIDPVRFDQILLNLAANARDAMPGGGTLQISCTAEGEEAVVAVHDNGSGMPPEVQAHIFEPFFTSGKPGGSGIGLATVAEIVAAAGGRIGVESRPGEGTCMTIRLPLLPPREVVPPAGPALISPSVRGQPPSRAILLVEDEELPRRLAARVLAGKGWQVRAVASVEAALAVAGEERLAAVVTDLELPDGDGAALVAALRRAPGREGLAAVIVSGHAPGQLRLIPEVAALLATVPERIFLLGKPYAPVELAAALAGVIGERSCRDELTNI